MSQFALGYACDECGKTYGIRETLNTCPSCGGLLEVQYDEGAMRRHTSCIASNERITSIWRYRDFFPQMEDKSIVSLGEGGTPLIQSVHIGPMLGLEKLFFKNDTMMPTGSFKDRGFSLAVSYAKEIGVHHGFTYSSGNAGASFAAYASRGDFNALVCVEHTASDTKKALIGLYGARTAILEFDNFEQYY